MAVDRITSTATAARISRNVSVPRQTPKTDFGTRLKEGLETAAGAMAAGAAVAAPFAPGAAILSAAVSSLTSQAAGLTAAVSPGGFSLVGAGAGGAGVSAGGPPTAALSGSLAGIQNDNLRMMEIQIAMQRENTVFSTLSNILKVRHDTQKNSIANIR
jgi:hypothetical protein